MTVRLNANPSILFVDDNAVDEGRGRTVMRVRRMHVEKVAMDHGLADPMFRQFRQQHDVIVVAQLGAHAVHVIIREAPDGSLVDDACQDAIPRLPILRVPIHLVIDFDPDEMRMVPVKLGIPIDGSP